MRALTPEYAAPEQVLGAPITVATDVYSLGVLLYTLLCGQHPTGDRSQSAPQFIRSLLETDPVRLSAAAAPVKLKRLFRGDLDNIVANALKKNPLERYASVKEFADDLRRYLHDEPVLARADNVGYRARKFIARNRLPVGIGAAALAAAEADARQALAVAQQAQCGLPYSDRTGLAWMVLGQVLAKRGEAAGASKAFHAAVENLSNTVDADHPMLLRARLLARN